MELLTGQEANNWYNSRQKKKPQTMAQPQQSSGGIVGFLQNAGKSFASDFTRLGQGTANVIDELTGGAQKTRDLNTQRNQEDIKLIKNYGQKIRNAKSPEEKQRYHNALASLMKTSGQQDTDFQKRQNEIIEQNDPLKGAASVAGIGLDVLGGGAGGAILKSGILKGVARAAGQGALFGGAQGALEPVKEKGSQASLEDILGNATSGAGVGALTGGALGTAGGVGSRLLGGASRSGTPSRALSRLGGKAERFGNDLLGSQANLTRSEARRIGSNPADVLGNINRRTGLNNLDDMAEVGKNLTGAGEDSLLDTLTRATVGESKGVNVGDLRRTAQTAIENGGSVLSDSQKKNLLRNMTQSGVAMRGGAEGSLSSLANPGKALDQANIFRSTARDLTKGINVSAEQRQQAKIYNDVASQIEDAIYSSPGVNESLPLMKKAGVDDLLFKAQDAEGIGNKAQAKAYRQLAEELGNVKDIKELRAMKKDFVDLSKVDEASARARAGAGAQLGDTMQGLGRFAQKPTNLLAIPLNASTPKVGGVTSNIGRLLKQKGPVSQKALATAFKPDATGNLTSPDLSKAGVAGGMFGGLVNPVVSRGAAMEQPEPTPDASMQLPEDTSMDTPDMSMAAPESNNIFSKQNIQGLILQDLANNEGKNVTQLLALYKAFGQDESQNLNATTQKALAQSANGEETVNQLAQLLQNAGGGQGNIGGGISGFLGGLGLNNNAKTYNDLARGSVSQIAKALGETGTLSDSDITTYSSMLPKLTDTEEVAQNKLAALRERLTNARQNTAQYGAGGTDDLMSLLGGE